MFGLKNLFKALGFVFVITLSIYYAIDTVQYKNNIMSFEDYDPPSSLKVEGEIIKKAKFTFIDVHSHLWNMPLMDLNELVAEMDEINMGYIVNLSGSGFGPQSTRASRLTHHKKVALRGVDPDPEVGLQVNRSG